VNFLCPVGSSSALAPTVGSSTASFTPCYLPPFGDTAEVLELALSLGSVSRWGYAVAASQAFPEHARLETDGWTLLWAALFVPGETRILSLQHGLWSCAPGNARAPSILSAVHWSAAPGQLRALRFATSESRSRMRNPKVWVCRYAFLPVALCSTLHTLIHLNFTVSPPQFVPFELL